MPDDRNVLGEKVDNCPIRPMSGFYRDRLLRDWPRERRQPCGVRRKMTEEFLAFSKSRGNDLSAPVPEIGFPGLQPGDRWCLCAARWKEAIDAGVAPRVVLRATHENALEYMSFGSTQKARPRSRLIQ